MSSDDLAAALERLTHALAAAHAARLGVPAELRPVVAEYARAARLAGHNVAALVIEVKRLVRHTTGADELIFTPRVVGWAIAAFFEGTSTREWR